MSTSQVFAEVADGMDGVGMMCGFQGQQKTHNWLERVGFMFKVHRFGTLYFVFVDEISRPCNLLISWNLLVALHGFEPRTCGL